MNSGLPRSLCAKTLIKITENEVLLCIRCFNLTGYLTENKFLHFNLVAGIIDVNANKPTFCIVIKKNTFRDFLTLYTRLLGQIDIQ